ncbi:MAG: hypothetical protein AB8G16_15225 [Gammaproteobacteria bacterium]
MFGWQPRSEDLGSVVDTECRACGRATPWHLHAVRMWISFFFVRVLPTGTEGWLRCNGCGDGFALGTDQSELVRRGDAADDPTIAQWIAIYQGRGNSSSL